VPGCVDVRAIDDDVGRSVGVLLAAAGGEDVVDAAVVLLAYDGDEIFPATRSTSVRWPKRPVGTWS